MQKLANGITVLALLTTAFAGIAQAADPLSPEARLVSAPNAPSPTQLAFTVATAEDLEVTLTDLQSPAPLTSASIVVTQGDAIAGSATLASPASPASFTIAGAAGSYTLWVFGTPGASTSVGSFIACVAPKSNPADCIQADSTAGLISAASSSQTPTVSARSTALNVTAAGSYTFTFSDLQFPVALSTAPILALFQGSAVIQTNITSGTAINLPAGSYTLLSIAQADPTAQAGLYGLTVAGPTTLFDAAIPVGVGIASSTFGNPAAQSLTLNVVDFSFPGALASASALLTTGGTAVGQATAAGGAMTFSAPAGAIEAWNYAAAGATSGTYQVEVSSPSQTLFTTAQSVNPSAASSFAYALLTPTSVPAGTYEASVADLQFPSQLSALSFAVAQSGAIIKQSTTEGSLGITTPASSAPVVFLVNAQPPVAGATSGNGLFDANLQKSGTSTPIYDRTQSVSSTPALFDSQTLNIGVAAGFTVTLTDLEFPAAFDNLAMVVSQGSQVLGKVYGSGHFSFPGSVGSYQLTFVASPASDQQFGLYGVSVLFSPPTVTTFKASATSAATNSPITLTWATTDATTCTGSGGAWNGSGTSGSQSVVLTATTTYTLSCTGAGGTTKQSLSVTATAAASSSGGGSISVLDILLLALGVAGLRARHLARLFGYLDAEHGP